MSSKLNYVIPVVCGLAFLVGLGIAVNPAISRVFADEPSATSVGDPGISLSLNGNTDMQKIVNTPGEVSYVDNTFSVKVTDSWYAVLIRAANGYTSDLTNQQNTNAKVTGVGINVPEANFKENTWGYALTTITSTEQSSSVDNKTLSYNTLPESNDFTPAYSNTVSGEQTQNFKVSFAAKFGNDAPSGHYQTKVYLSAVSDPTQVTTMFNVDTMQELGANPSECARVAENTTKRLIDIRDNKKYWVTKLADGNCWMTQNLDFDIPETLSNKSSDVDATSVATEITEASSVNSWPSKDDDISRYIDPGEWYYSFADGAQGSSATVCHNIRSFANSKCTPAYFMPVTANTTEEKLHYHVGNYYNFNAATVRSGLEMESGNAPNSICPKGWKLPTSGEDNTGNGTFGGLMSAYGLSDEILSTSRGTLYAAPMYFVYGGHLSTSYINYAATNGDYWSATIKDESNSYRLYFNTIVNPFSAYERFRGYYVRCVLVP